MPLAVQVRTQSPSRTTETRAERRTSLQGLPQDSQNRHGKVETCERWNEQAALRGRPGAITECWNPPARCPCSPHSRSSHSTEATGSGFDSTGSTAGHTAGERSESSFWIRASVNRKHIQIRCTRFLIFAIIFSMELLAQAPRPPTLL